MPSWFATSDTVPARSPRGSNSALPSKRNCAGQRLGSRPSRLQPSGLRSGAIRAAQLARLAVSCPRAGLSRLLPARTTPQHCLAGASQSDSPSPYHQATAPNEQWVGRQRAAPRPTHGQRSKDSTFGLTVSDSCGRDGRFHSVALLAKSRETP